MPAKTSRSTKLLITCEHAGNEVPDEYRHLFAGAEEVLQSHRGWDPGALEVAEEMADRLQTTLFVYRQARLLIEPNRSRHHRSLLSEFTRDLPPHDKQRLIDEFYLPHRRSVERHIASEVAAGHRVLHIGVHTFTPVLNGEVRNADIGLLYDPVRAWEKQFCARWRQSLVDVCPTLRVRLNYPYRGADDGFTTFLRTKFNNAQYAGVELEVNQRFPQGNRAAFQTLQGALIGAFDAALATLSKPEP